jgi:hypothetical protein
MKEVISKWKEFSNYAIRHNEQQPGYPDYFEDGIPLTFRAFMEWLEQSEPLNGE